MAWLAIITALAACSPGSSSQRAADSATIVGAGIGPGISVAEALASRLEGPLLVNGSLWAKDQDVRLCAALTDAVPPQCTEPSLTISGLDLGAVVDLRSERGVSWSQRPIQLVGEVRGGVLTIEALSKG